MSKTRELKISPSMMCADFLHLADELALFDQAGIEWLHIDVMDGHYVPNFTLGPDICRALEAGTAIPQDVHLMVEEPDRHIDSFLQLKAPRISFHPETVRQPVRVIDRIHEGGGTAGIAIDPALPLQNFRHLLPLVEQVVIMTVNPGYAGQKLIPHTLDKIAETREYLDSEGLSAEIEVDGNVSWQNIPKMAAAGANIFVAGTSSVFDKTIAREEALGRMRDLLAKSGGFSSGG